jgi:hypothetical protein
MAFHPNEPHNGEVVDADVLRDNFTALKTEIEAVPAGITQATLDAAINTRAMTVVDVDPLDFQVSDEYDKAQLVAIYDKLNETLALLKGQSWP